MINDIFLYFMIFLLYVQIILQGNRITKLEAKDGK